MANLLVGLIYFNDYSLEQWFAWGAFDRVLHLGLEILAVVILYVAALLMLGIRPRHLLLKH